MEERNIAKNDQSKEELNSAEKTLSLAAQCLASRIHATIPWAPKGLGSHTHPVLLPAAQKALF